MLQRLLLVTAFAATLAGFAAGSQAASFSRADAHLSLVAYSTPAGAFAKIIPAFQATPAGSGVSFDQSYGPAESQVRAIEAGLPADVVDLSLEPNVTELVAAGLVDADWNENAHHGFVTRSVVAFAVRAGNPKHIRTWDDLVKPGVEVVTPNPFSSGGARWNVMAAYGAMLREHKTPKQAVAYLRDLFANHVVSQDSSARNALQTFLAGKGDVLLTYENEAILAQQQSQPIYYLAPKATIMIENPVAVISKSPSRAAAQAFVSFLYTPAAQTIFAQNGYRPVVPSVYRRFAAEFPMPKQLFKIAYVGGWPAVTKRFFDPVSGIMARIEQGLGVSAGG
jgi:sulfate/thiosulfate transport system substrate-binding protein